MEPKAEATSQFGSEEMEFGFDEVHGLISETGSTSFMALLELPPPRAVELLVKEDFPAKPVFPCNVSLIDHESMFSVFGLAYNSPESNTVLSVSSPMKIDVVKREPLDNSSSPAVSNQSPKSSKRKEREKKVKESNKKCREVITNEPSGDGGEQLPYIHVRARHGQATNNHSLAERARRDKINARMKLLQELVPGCDKISGTAMVLDEIINHVQSLQHQVEFLSTRLAAVNPRIDFNLDALLAAGGSSVDNGYTGMFSPSMLPGEQINENRQPQYQHQWQSNEPHRPFWGPEEDNSNFLTPQNTLLSYDSSPNSGPVSLHSSQLKMEL